MIALALLAGFVVGAGAALFVGLPAYRRGRARQERLLHEQRYLAWRGRARQPAGTALDAYEAARDRTRLIVAAVLGAIALVSLVGFFVVSG